MSSSPLSALPLIFSQLISQIPVIAVCVVAIVMLSGRRAAAPTATGWAIGAFALTGALSLLFPILYGVLMFLQRQGDMPISSISWIYPILGFAGSLLHTGAYVLLLIAFLKFLRPAAPTAT